MTSEKPVCLYEKHQFQWKINKFQADRMLFVGMVGRKSKRGRGNAPSSPIGLGLTIKTMGGGGVFARLPRSFLLITQAHTRELFLTAYFVGKMFLLAGKAKTGWFSNCCYLPLCKFF